MNIVYQNLDAGNLDRIREIDREEDISGIYEHHDGKLVLISQEIYVKAFPKEELNEIIQRQHKLLNEGGEVIGAFHENMLVGVVSIENKRRGRLIEYCKMDILYLSKQFRGLGIGHNLIEKSKVIARQFGATKLYISATPSKNTVDFYLKHHASLVEEVDEELFAMEPNDIHLEIIL